MEHGRGYLEDLPLPVRAALYNITLGRDAKEHLSRVLDQAQLGEHYQEIHGKIHGKNSMTPSLLVTLCKAISDWTPVEMLFAHYGVRITIERESRVTGELLNEVLEAVSAVGNVANEFNTVLTNKRTTKHDLALVAQRAQEAMQELRDILTAIARQSAATRS